MTISELQILLDLNRERKIDILKKCTKNGFFFIDSDDGQCYLFDGHGNLDDVSKVKAISEDCIPKDIVKIVIPNGVTYIEKWAFYACRRLMSVSIPDSVTSIKDFAFDSCTSLMNVTIPDNVTDIGWAVFGGCSKMASVTIPNNVMHIGEKTFRWCGNLKELIFKGKSLDEVRSMENYPFGIEDESIIKCI